MKEQVLTCIYSVFDRWMSQWDLVCKKGCSTCCSQHVTMTGLEGERIYCFFANSHRQKDLTKVLRSVDYTDYPGSTTNEFVAGCLNNQNVESMQRSQSDPCPFLSEHSCTIYEVRPFNCRCFVSAEKCDPNHGACAPDFIFTASTTVMQIIEHLDQKGKWGNMIDILCLRSGIFTDTDHIHKRVYECKPLPGFLIPPEDFKQVQPLLESIFSEEVNGKSIETILNGR